MWLAVTIFPGISGLSAILVNLVCLKIYFYLCHFVFLVRWSTIVTCIKNINEFLSSRAILFKQITSAVMNVKCV